MLRLATEWAFSDSVISGQSTIPGHSGSLFLGQRHPHRLEDTHILGPQARPNKSETVGLESAM